MPRTLVPPAARILTHCNAGGLATGGYGSAVGAIRAAAERGGVAHVWVDETRPLLQGARLTAFELEALGIPHAVIVDGAAASLDGRRRGRRRDHGRGPDRRERRHREQDRHVRARGARAPPRDPVRDRGADLDDRPDAPRRRRDPDRGARRRRGDGPLRGPQPRLRRHPGRPDRGDRDRGGRASRAVRRVAAGAR